MPRTIIGLDISEDTVVAVQVKSLMQGYQIIGCSAVPITEAGGISVALRGVCEEIDSKGSVCNSVIEDGHVSFRNLSMPFSDLRKIRQTIGFELETVAAFSVDEQLIDFIDIDRTDSQTNIIAASANRAYIGDHLSHFESLGVEPEVLDIRNVSLVNQIMMQQNSPGNGLLLSLGSKICTILLFLDKRIVLLRQLSFSGKDLEAVASLAAKREKANLSDTAQYEAGLVSLCRSINLTLRGFQVESGRKFQPEKVFITGPGALVSASGEIIGRELNLPVSNLNLREKDKRV